MEGAGRGRGAAVELSVAEGGWAAREAEMEVALKVAEGAVAVGQTAARADARVAAWAPPTFR